MAVKVYFNNQIHRFAKLPTSLEELIAHITSLFKNELPSSWKIEYLDSEGDRILLSHEYDFKELLEIESSTLGSTLKLYVTPNEETCSNVSNFYYQQAENSLLEEYEVIQTSPIVQQSGLSSQNQGEKTASVGHLIQQKNEVKPQVIPQPKNEGLKTENNIQFYKAKHLVKILVRGKYPETMKDQLLAELNAIKETLTEDEKKRLEEKKEKFQETFAHRQGHWKGHRRHYHHSPEGFGWKRFGRFGSLSEEEKENSKSPFRLFKFMKAFKKFFKAQRKGKVEKAAKRKQKLFDMIPEESHPVLEAMLVSLPKDLDKEVMKQRFQSGIQKFIEECFPEGKDKILEELEKAKERRKYMKEHRRHHSKGKHGHGKHFFKWMHSHREKSLEMPKKDQQFEGVCEKFKGKRMFGHWHKMKTELQEKYSEGVFKKATTLKIVFPQEEFARLCDYVKEEPEELSMEDLALNFRKKVKIN